MFISADDVWSARYLVACRVDMGRRLLCLLLYRWLT